MRLPTAALLVAAGCAACGDDRAGAARTQSRLAPAPAAPATATVSVAGTVIDRDTRDPVAEVEVVLRGEHGEVTARTAANGVFGVEVARGPYRVFVRDARAISTGTPGRRRLPGLPSSVLAGAPDESLMPVIDIDADTSGIELAVTTAAVINGVISDPDGHPVPDVVVHAAALETIVTGPQPRVGPPIPRTAAPRPVLGTDTGISDAEGRFVLRVPPGRYELEASHARHAGVGGIAELELTAGARYDAMLTLARGCIVTGRVVGSDGAPPLDGALEMRSSLGTFGPGGRIDADGTFTWTSTASGDVSLRAWPWKSPPSPPQTFPCQDGKIYSDVVFRVGNDLPDITGTIIDARGEPVPLAFIDVAALDFNVGGQQERADAAGIWHVYHMPAGRYHVTATAPGRGVVAMTMVAPADDVRLQLSGTGRLAGTTSELVDGSFELTFEHCGPAASAIELQDDARIVVVSGGRFVVDRVPACTLTFAARWRDRTITHSTVIEPDRTTHIELALGSPRDKTVHGVVRGLDGAPVANARVTAVVDKLEATTVRTDDTGAFTLTTRSGAQLVAGNGRHVGRAHVGRANVAAEQVDIVLDDASE